MRQTLFLATLAATLLLEAGAPQAQPQEAAQFIAQWQKSNAACRGPASSFAYSSSHCPHGEPAITAHWPSGLGSLSQCST